MYVSLAYYDGGEFNFQRPVPLAAAPGGYCIPAFPGIVFARPGLFQLVGDGLLGLPLLRERSDVVAYVGSAEECSAFLAGFGSGMTTGIVRQAGQANRQVRAISPSLN